MDRGAWWATVHGIARVGHDLVTRERERERERERRFPHYMETKCLYLVCK